jgi:hypothetical protein
MALAFGVSVSYELSRLEPLLGEHSRDDAFNTTAGGTLPLGEGLTITRLVRLAPFTVRHSVSGFPWTGMKLGSSRTILFLCRSHDVEWNTDAPRAAGSLFQGVYKDGIIPNTEWV